MVQSTSFGQSSSVSLESLSLWKTSAGVAKAQYKKAHHVSAFLLSQVFKEGYNNSGMQQTRWQFYLKSEDAWEAMLSACKQATKTIDMEQFIFTPDAIGNRFIEVFKKKSKEGLRVRLICDMVGSALFHNSPAHKELERVGVEIQFFNIVSPWRINNFFSWFFRDHRKILVIDREIAFTGGVGIREDMRNWRDTHVAMNGPVVHELRLSFEEMWLASKGKNVFSRIRKSRRYAKGFHFITNSPYWKKRFLYHTILDAMRSARSYIYLTTPYFVPDGRMLRVLRQATLRGVDVRILLPAQSNHPIVDLASFAHFEMLMRDGIKIYQHHGQFLHAKTLVIDDEWATVGSFNMDSLSFIYNHEANIVSTDQIFIEAVKRHFLGDIRISKLLHIQTWRKRSFLGKIKEYCVIPLRGFL